MQTFDPARFLAVRDQVLSAEHETHGIGTLGEKSLHRILKTYYEPVEAFHEQKIGRYVADILNEDGIVEIQTRQLSKMQEKLKTFLSVAQVMVVHPVVHEKWLTWVDVETGEMTRRRKSPKKGSIYDAFWEMGGIHTLLSNPNLTICLTMLDMEETRLLNGWSHDKKRGSTRADRIPTALVSEIRLHSKEDYLALLPNTLPQTFVCSELALAVGQRLDRIYSMLRVLRGAGAVREIGRRGREKLYQKETD